MTDHHAAALHLAEAEPTVALAQVHATLALAEQQRIANLIALYVGDSKKHPAGGEIGDDAYNLLADSDVRRALRIENTDD